MRHTLVVFVMVGVGLCAAPASAEIIYLRCGADTGVTHTIDTDHKTADNYPARINPTSIDWTVAGSAGVTAYWHIDRVTGVATQRVVTNANGGQYNSGPIQCSATTPPDKKF